MAKDQRQPEEPPEQQPALNREQRRHGTAALPSTPPPDQPTAETNPAVSERPKDSYTGKSDQDVTRNTGAGAGGATEWGGGNKNHPSRIAGKPPGT